MQYDIILESKQILSSSLFIKILWSLNRNKINTCKTVEYVKDALHKPGSVTIKER